MRPITLRDMRDRRRAIEAVEQAPHGSVVSVRAQTRSVEQNSRLWAMLHDVSEQKPMGRMHTPDEWKAIFMQACGWESQFLPGLSGGFFPIGYRSSRMTVPQMAELITFMFGWGAEVGIRWSEPHPDERRSA